MVIIYHYPHSAKHYSETIPFPGHSFSLPDRCPHPDCHVAGALIRWGTYTRWACTREADYPIRVQRIRCKDCGRTHSLLPDFLHPYRHYVLALLQRIVSLYILAGVSIDGLMERLLGQGPVRSTVREWLTAFAYGAGRLLFAVLSRHLMELSPLAELPEAPPPNHLDRIPARTKRRHLKRAYRFWRLAEQLYALIKRRQPRLHFTTDQLLAFVLHWLQSQGIPPRLFWSPRLSTTPTAPF